jgi:hypothetical protein
VKGSVIERASLQSSNHVKLMSRLTTQMFLLSFVFLELGEIAQLHQEARHAVQRLAVAFKPGLPSGLLDVILRSDTGSDEERKNATDAEKGD